MSNGSKVLKKELIAECAEDYVGLWSVIRDVEAALGTPTEAELKTGCLMS